MCGIAGIYLKDVEKPYFSPDEIENLADVMLLGIEHRGYDAAGIAAMNQDGEVWIEKADTTATNFTNWRRPIPFTAKSILLHTRAYTKGSPMNLLNNHPVANGNAIITHNGHINNDDDLFKRHEMQRFGEVDSEVIAALFNKFGLEDPNSALEVLDGGFAIAAIDKRNPGKLVLAKGKYSPLYLLNVSGAIIWASTIKTMEEALQICCNFETKWNDYQEFQQGQILTVQDDEYEVSNFKPYEKPYKVIYSGKAESVVETSGRNTRYGWDDGLYTGANSVWYCEECYDINDRHALRVVNGKQLCIDCEEDFFADEMARDYHKDNSVGQISSGHEVITIDVDPASIALDNEHWRACEIVAEQFNTQVEFVDWMLFNDDEVGDRVTDNNNFINVYMAMNDAYDEAIKKLSGESEEDIDEGAPAKVISFLRRRVGF